MNPALPAFAVAALLTIAIPGPTSLLAFSNGGRHGLRKALSGIAGAVLSDLVLIAAVSAGLGALLSTSQLLFSVVKWLGVYGPPKTLYNRWKRWSDKGVFARMMDGLASEAAVPKTVMIDATYLKARRTATSLRSKKGVQATKGAV